jgi:hypothetical protein
LRRRSGRFEIEALVQRMTRLDYPFSDEHDRQDVGGRRARSPCPHSRCSSRTLYIDGGTTVRLAIDMTPE